MGTSNTKGAPTSLQNVGTIHKFYSSSAWIEGKAEEQLQQIATLPGVNQVAAFPDLHLGKYGPVGSAILSDKLYPQLIGNDIGCGMSLFLLDLPARKVKAEKAAKRLRQLEGIWQGNGVEMLESVDLPTDLYSHSLGTIGGGNHFCELQGIGEIFSEEQAKHLRLNKSSLILFVHSGSRAFGMKAFTSAFNENEPSLDPNSEQGKAYLRNHDLAVRWASLNRYVIGLRAAQALRSDMRLLCDSPHNLIETYEDQYLHRKGAAKANVDLVPLAGSRDTLSYLLNPTSEDKNSLASLAHGAGRKYDRSSMHGRIKARKSDQQRLQRTSFGGHVVCEDKALLIEEAPEAYKSADHVVQDLVSAKLASVIVSLKPIVTFKKARIQKEGTYT